MCRTKQLEGKLATLTVINSALQNENETLRQQLESAKAPSSTTDAELRELQEEFTRRLATADKTITSLKVCIVPAINFTVTGLDNNVSEVQQDADLQHF